MSDNKELIAAWVKARNDTANILFESSLEIHMAIEPALTAEEWKVREFESQYGLCTTSIEVDHKGRLSATSVQDGTTDLVILNEAGDTAALHKTAALCLNGQSFGFTREDVATLSYAYTILSLADERVIGVEREPRMAALRSLHDRIEAFLPPEST